MLSCVYKYRVTLYRNYRYLISKCLTNHLQSMSDINIQLEEDQDKERESIEDDSRKKEPNKQQSQKINKWKIFKNKIKEKFSKKS